MTSSMMNNNNNFIDAETIVNNIARLTTLFSHDNRRLLQHYSINNAVTTVLFLAVLVAEIVQETELDRLTQLLHCLL